MRSLILVPLLLGATPALAQRAATYRAAGDGWTLSVGLGSIDYRGRTHVITPTPPSRPSFNGDRLVTPRIVIDITHSPCTLRSNGARFRDTVRVTTGGRTVVGCGGGLIGNPGPRPLPPQYDPRPEPGRPAPPPQGSGAEGIDRSSWTIISVDGRTVRTARATSVRFRDGRIDGNGGCNSFNGSYSLRRDTLTAARIVSTRMACRGSGAEVERALFATLEGGAELDRQGRDRLVLEGRDHTITLGRVNDPDAAYRDDNGYHPDDDVVDTRDGYQRGRYGRNGEYRDDQPQGRDDMRDDRRGYQDDSSDDQPDDRNDDRGRDDGKDD